MPRAISHESRSHSIGTRASAACAQPHARERAPDFCNSAYKKHSHLEITEHVRHSWFIDNGGGRHPWEGETIPDYQPDSDRYSFAKAPRYKGKVVQLGPLAEFVIAGDPLITSFFKAEGPNTWLRQFVRLHRPVAVLRQMRSSRGLTEITPSANAETRYGPHRKYSRADFREVGSSVRGSRVRVCQCRTRQFGSLAADGWGQDQKLPSHHSYFMEWLTARLFGNAGSLGGKLYRS